MTVRYREARRVIRNVVRMAAIPIARRADITVADVRKRCWQIAETHKGPEPLRRVLEREVLRGLAVDSVILSSEPASEVASIKEEKLSILMQRAYLKERTRPANIAEQLRLDALAKPGSLILTEAERVCMVRRCVFDQEWKRIAEDLATDVDTVYAIGTKAIEKAAAYLSL